MNPLKPWFLVAFGAVLFLSAESEQKGATWDGWGKTTADKLAAFLPSPVPGLVDRMPWEPDEPAKPHLSGGCGETHCGAYFPLDVSRRWYVSNPALVQEYETVHRQLEVLLKRAKGLDSKTQMAEIMKLAGEAGKLGKKKDDLKFSARTISLSIRGNYSAVDVYGPKVKSIGAVKKYPFYRSGVGREFSLAVYVGPAGFQNPTLKKGELLRAELKCLLVQAWVYSSEKDVKSDEALARQLLEKVDYAGLAKLPAP